MKREHAELLRDACAAADIKCEVRSDYSGRWMYGRTTYAVVVHSMPALLMAMVNYIPAMEEDDKLVRLPKLTDLNEDDMGRDVVVY